MEITLEGRAAELGGGCTICSPLTAMLTTAGSTRSAKSAKSGKDVPNGILNTIGDNIPRKPISITVKSGDQYWGNVKLDNPSNYTYSKSIMYFKENSPIGYHF